MTRTIVITGSATGMGAQLASELRERGDRVIGLDIAQPTVELDGFFLVDLSDADSIRGAAAQVVGPLDALVHCAGIPQDVAPDATVLSVNFLGLRDLTRALLPQIADGGSVLSIASIAGHRWRDRDDAYRELLSTDSIRSGLAWYEQAQSVQEKPIYAVSKEAVWAYTSVLAGHLFDRRIRVNSVCPGLIETRLLQHFVGAMSDSARATIDSTVGRALQPAEITAVMRFLLSDDAALINGQNVIVDGGYLPGVEFAAWAV